MRDTRAGDRAAFFMLGAVVGAAAALLMAPTPLGSRHNYSTLITRSSVPASSACRPAISTYRPGSTIQPRLTS